METNATPSTEPMSLADLEENLTTILDQNIPLNEKMALVQVIGKESDQDHPLYAELSDLAKGNITEEALYTAKWVLENIQTIRSTEAKSREQSSSITKIQAEFRDVSNISGLLSDI